MGGHHHHGHYGHSHHDSNAGGGRLLFSVLLNLVITIAEVVGGILSGSLALISDALHNFSDTTSLGISYAAQRISRRDANQRKTFGYRRAEIIGAFVNLVTLVLIALFLVKEAIERLLDPQSIDGSVMMTVALIGLAANIGTAFLLFRYREGNLNIRSAFLHVIGDAVSSVGVVLGGLFIIQFEIYILDPLLTIGISLYLLYHSYGMLRQTVDILMESTPRGMDLDELVAEVGKVDQVLDVHHVHVWQLDETHLALEAHVVVDADNMRHMEAIKHTIKDLLASRYNISHSTLEFEFAPCVVHDHAHCYNQAVYSHAY